MVLGVSESLLIYESVEVIFLSKIFYYTASATTFLAGILLLILYTLHTPIDGTAIFFLVSGDFQIFWAIPVMKRWGNYWYYVGIIGSLISIAIYVEYPIYVLGIATEVLQAIFIVICTIILWKRRGMKGVDRQAKEQT